MNSIERSRNHLREARPMTSSDANTVENVAALAIFFAYFLELKNHSVSLGWSHVNRHQVVIMQIDPPCARPASASWDPNSTGGIRGAQNLRMDHARDRHRSQANLCSGGHRNRPRLAPFLIAHNQEPTRSPGTSGGMPRNFCSSALLRRVADAPVERPLQPPYRHHRPNSTFRLQPRRESPLRMPRLPRLRGSRLRAHTHLLGSAATKETAPRHHPGEYFVRARPSPQKA